MEDQGHCPTCKSSDRNVEVGDCYDYWHRAAPRLVKLQPVLGDWTLEPIQAPRSMNDGPQCSPSTPSTRRQLNPVFVEMLMDFPPGWTSLAPLGCDSRGTL